MELETMAVAVEDGIARLTLSRPEAFNAMNAAFWTDMIEAFDHIAADGSVRVVLLASQGKHFTAGLDLKWAGTTLGAADGDAGRQRETLRRKILKMQGTMSVVERARVPVIAVVQGGCIGGGVDLVTACDIRIGTEDCYFTIQEVNVAIVADVGTLQRLPHLLPQGLVRELAYTGRRFPAAEALHHGFLNRAEASHEAAIAAGLELAREIASKSPMTIAGIKHVLNRGRGRTVEDGLEHVALWNSAMLPGDDMATAVRALLAKEQPRFADLNGA